MSGILDFLGNSIGTPGGDGILGWLTGTPQALQGEGVGPNPSVSRLGIVGSALQDMQGAIDGRPTNFTQSSVMGQKGAIANADFSKRVRDAYASGDMNAVRQALMDHAVSGGDISHITGAMTSMQPKIQDIGGTGYSIDPLTGQATEAVKPHAKAPPGFDWGEDGKLHFIPGGPVDPEFARKLSGAKRKPAGSGLAGPSLATPWSMYGGQ